MQGEADCSERPPQASEVNENDRQLLTISIGPQLVWVAQKHQACAHANKTCNSGVQSTEVT